MTQKIASSSGDGVLTFNTPLSKSGSVVSIDLAAYQPLLTASPNLSTASLSVNNALGGIDNNALIYGRGISITTSDVWHSFYVNETDGFRYQYSRLTLPTTINRATVQSNSAGSLISYNSNNVTVNNSGVTSTPLTIVTPDSTNGLVIKKLEFFSCVCHR